MQGGLKRLLELDCSAVQKVVEAFTHGAPCRVLGYTALLINIPIDIDGIEPVRYGESVAWVLRGEVGKPGLMKLRLPNSGEGDKLHRHPKNDRILWVLAGKGTFHYVEDGMEVVCQLSPGSQVFMRRGKVHTAKGPLTILSMLNPFLPLDDPGNFQLYQQ